MLGLALKAVTIHLPGLGKHRNRELCTPATLG